MSLTRNQRVLFAPLKLESGLRSPETSAPYTQRERGAWGPRPNTAHAGPEICVHLSIALLFSRQVAISNAGPILALESMGAKQYFRSHFLNIGQM